MKNTFFLITLVLLACSKDDNDRMIDPQTAIEECQQNRYTDSLTITENLLGDWKLIEYNCGFCPPPVDQPLVNITFKNGTGTLYFRASSSDTLMTTNFTWSLQQQIVTPETNSGFILFTTPSHWALTGFLFCEEYMYYNMTPVDGHSVLYRKQ